MQLYIPRKNLLSNQNLAHNETGYLLLGEGQSRLLP